MKIPEITQQQLQELLSYDPLTGDFTWKVSPPYKKLIGKKAGSFDDDGYRQIKINKRGYRAHRLAWLYVYGSFPEFLIDHLNGIKSDNRIKNLRVATSSENMRNQTKHSDGESGFKGVTFHKQANKWQAACWANGKQRYLGLYSDALTASLAYDAFALQHHGEFFRR